MNTAISIVIPYYKGSRYIQGLMDCLQEQAMAFYEMHKQATEIVFVNDSPDESLVVDGYNHDILNVKVVYNEKNSGIHYSRVNGLHHASSPYVLFLDQDDFLLDHALVKLYQMMLDKDADIIVGNGYYDLGNEKPLIFADEWSLEFATKYSSYINNRNFIVSPGQCLIKKDAIPQQWENNILTKNGADDYLLWLYMFNNGKKFAYLFDSIYVHVATDSNVSDDRNVMRASTENLLGILRNDKTFDRNVLKKLERRIAYKNKIGNNKLKLLLHSIFNFDLFIANIHCAMKWRGCKKRY